MVWARRRGSVTFWAWVVSIGVHLIVLTALGSVKFSQSKSQVKQRPVPTAKVSQIQKLIEAAPVIPKPKVKKPPKNLDTRRTARLLPVNQIFDIAKLSSQDQPNLEKPSVSTSELSSARNAILPEGIEFFGSFTEQRKVCYLVDCSGSMQGVFGRVRKKLKDSIASLQPDHYFYVIFFGDGKLFESGKGQLVRATDNAKSAAYSFIDSAEPAGQTNAMEALERAVQIRDGRAQSPSIIYFLTDGFELTSQDERRFSRKIANLLKKFAPRTKINTIGFWAESSDRKMLETIARQSGGEFVLVSDGDR
jgi:hypothetical protein